MRAASRPSSPVALPALLLALGSLVAIAPADAVITPTNASAALPGSPHAAGTAAVAPHPVRPRVATYPVHGVSPAGLRAWAATSGKAVHTLAMTQRLAAVSAPEPAHGVAVAGVTWAGPAPRGLALALRTRTNGTWSGWTTMPYDADHGPDPTSAEARNARPGSDPFVVGTVDDVQLKVQTSTGAVPKDLSLSVVNPGTSSSDAHPQPITPDEAAETLTPPATSTVGRSASGGSGSLAQPTEPVRTQSATPMPTIYSRADWGADERLRGCCVEYGEVHAGFVHHTVNANGYTKAEVPAILRGIYAYHTQSRGWRDIGYNYLIDRFGRIWEGRYGGITLPVVGAHTLNYNENSFAASAIGNYDIARPSAAMVDAYARLYAWKLSLHGVRPTSRQNVAGTTFNAISGHRDAAQTACPGRYLYAKIPTIIAQAQKYQHGFLGRDLQHSFVRDSRPDLLMVDQAGAVSVARGTGPPGFAAPVVPSGVAGPTSLAGMDRVVPVGDVTGDHVNDLMARNASTGSTAVYPGVGDGTFGAPIRPVMRWAGDDLFAGVGDVTGDHRNDVVGRSATTGGLRVYPGRGAGRFGAGRVAITQAAGFTLLTGGGDFNRDGYSDLVTRGTNGTVLVWYGDGQGGFPTHQRLARDWSGKDMLSGGADLTGDGMPDLVARSATTHVVSTFANIGGDSLSPAIGQRRSVASRLALSGDLTGDHRADLVGLTRAQTVEVFAGNKNNWLHAPVSRGTTWAGVDKVLVVGDWDRDGYVDAMARRRSDGAMQLYRGTSTGTFAAPVGSWAGWGSRRLITPVGDVNGDGHPDLMAQASNGSIYLYPGRGRHGFAAPVIMRSSLPKGSNVVAVGLWTKDGTPDVLVRTAAGQLLLYPGNGPGGLDDPVVIGRNLGRYTTLVGVGDLTGDGQADLVGRRANGQAWLLPGRTLTAKAPHGGLGPPQYLAADWSAYRLG